MQQRQYPPAPSHVYLFGTCLIDMFVPQAGVDAVRLLEREGITVHFPQGQSCCGQPAYSSGNREQARAVARAQLPLFANDWPIVVPSGSCGGMMRHHWPLLFDDEPETARAAQAIAARVYELGEFLLNVLGVDFGDKPDVQRSGERVVLHTSCGARREMGTREHGVALLDALPGVTRIDHVHESECCGFGGTFSLKHPDISGAMVKDKIAAAMATGCERLVSADCGCLLNIGHAAQHQGVALPVEHLASFLWRRSGGEPE